MKKAKKKNVSLDRLPTEVLIYRVNPDTPDDSYLSVNQTVGEVVAGSEIKLDEKCVYGIYRLVQTCEVKIDAAIRTLK